MLDMPAAKLPRSDFWREAWCLASTSWGLTGTRSSCTHPRRSPTYEARAPRNDRGQSPPVTCLLSGRSVREEAKLCPPLTGRDLLISFPCKEDGGRREVGVTAGPGGWTDLGPVVQWEECSEGARGGADSPRMPVVSCPCSALVGTHTGSESGNRCFPSTRRDKHREEIPTHIPGD